MFCLTVSFTSFLFINCLITNAYCDTSSCDEFNDMDNGCTCAESPAPHRHNILCTGTDLKEIPNELTSFSGHFRLLHIHDTNLTDIKADAFSSPTFEQIFIEDNQLLTQIDKHAFNYTLRMKYLVIRNNPVLNVGDLFKLASILQPTDQLELQSDQLTRIPANAFANNTNVIHVFLHNNKIDTITGGDTFKGLTNLTQLRLDGNQMTTIEALEFNSNSDLSVYLNDNNLTMPGFRTAPISSSKNGVKLYLQDNQFTYLNRTIFEPFVKNNSNHELYFHNNEFECDSRSKWVQKHTDNIFNVWCMKQDASIFSIKFN